MALRRNEPGEVAGEAGLAGRVSCNDPHRSERNRPAFCDGERLHVGLLCDECAVDSARLVPRLVCLPQSAIELCQLLCPFTDGTLFLSRRAKQVFQVARCLRSLLADRTDRLEKAPIGSFITMVDL